MTPRLTDDRRRASRTASVRRLQGGAAACGMIVAAGIVTALVLQLAGPRLQGRLADLVGMPRAASVMAPASAPSCGSPSGANPMHPCKVVIATAFAAPVI